MDSCSVPGGASKKSNARAADRARRAFRDRARRACVLCADVGAGAGVLAVAATVALYVRELNRRTVAALAERDEALRQVQVLGDVAHELNSTLDPAQVLSNAVRLAAEIASPPGAQARRANYCRISGETVQVVAECDPTGDYLGATWPLSEHPLLARAARERVPTSGALDPATLGPRVRELAAAQQVGYAAWVPVIVSGELHGVLAVAGRNRAVSEVEVERCVAIVRILELALENAIAHERTQRAARTDPLTSLANRRAMEEQVAARRGRRPMAVLAIDVDNLKGVNDAYGHAGGDTLLLHLAEVIASTARSGDVVARVGGDEFVCVLFDADEQDGARVAQRILEMLAHPLACRLAPCVSGGVAYATADEALEIVLDRADAAMYEAKRAGGKRYNLSSPGLGA
jgi:diguanylate cyclase (GGDEF)-like protein